MITAGRQPSKNGTPQPGGNGVHLDTPRIAGNGVQLNSPANSRVWSPQGLTDYQGLPGLSGTSRDSQGVGKPTCVSILSLPWEHFLARAYEANRERLSEIETEGGLDTTWQLETPLFRFTHLVWSRTDLGTDANRPAALFAKVESSLKRWTASYRRKNQEPPHGFTGDAWQEWFGIAREDAKTEFLSLWPKFRFPANQSPLDAAVMLARRMLLCPTDEVCQRRAVELQNGRARPEGYVFFLSVCGHLQALRGDKPILLPQDSLATALRVQGRTVSRWRQWAVEDGMLRQTAPPGRRRAAEYRFDVSRWKTLETKAPPGTAEGFSK